MKTIETNNAPNAVGPYSQAVEINGFIYTSGQIPLTPEGEIISDDLAEQTHQVMKNIRAILKEEGLNFTDVVKSTIFIIDMGTFGIVNEVYGTYFTGKLPARSCVEVSRLPKDAKVKIEVIAHKSVNED